MKLLTYPQVEFNTILLFLNQIDCLPTLDLIDYDTLFEARHGRGAIDNMPKSGEEAIATSSIGIPPVILNAGMTENPMIRVQT